MTDDYLLDTQVALWLLLGDPRLDERTFRSRFDKPSSSLIFHQVSTWEIQIKYAIGKLRLPSRPQTFLLQAIESAGLAYRTIEDDGIFLLDRLPDAHRDPFDRLLAAHVIAGGWTLITADPVFEKYPVKLEMVGG
jgi:PIN domain nuclease of toxin-antitoxin system